MVRIFPKANSKQKGGAPLSFPDVCKVPAPPAPFVPVPYPNIAQISTNMKSASVKIKGLEKLLDKSSKLKSSSGDEAGTLNGMMSCTSKIKTLFSQQSVKIKVTGKKASRVLDLTQMNKAGKLYKTAEKQQKTFEKGLQKECDELLKACKGNKDQEKVVKKIVAMVGKAARGHKV